MQETQVWSLGWEDLLEKGMANPLQNSCLGNHMDRGTWEPVWDRGLLQSLVKSYSKFSKTDFGNMWTVNSRMFKLVLEKAEEPEIKLPMLDHGKSKRVPEKHLFLLYWLCQTLWLCGSQETVENSERDGNTRPSDLPLPAGQEASVRTGHGTTDWFRIGKGVCQGCVLSLYLFTLYS